MLRLVDIWIFKRRLLGRERYHWRHKDKRCEAVCHRMCGMSEENGSRRNEIDETVFTLFDCITTIMKSPLCYVEGKKYSCKLILKLSIQVSLLAK